MLDKPTAKLRDDGGFEVTLENGFVCDVWNATSPEQAIAGVREHYAAMMAEPEAHGVTTYRVVLQPDTCPTCKQPWPDVPRP